MIMPVVVAVPALTQSHRRHVCVCVCVRESTGEILGRGVHDRVHAVRKRILPTRHSDEQPIRTRERQSAPPPRDDEGTPNEYAQRTPENHLARIVVYTLWPSRPRQIVYDGTWL